MDDPRIAQYEQERTEATGAAIIPQCPVRKVGESVYTSVPGPVPMVKARRATRHRKSGWRPRVDLLA